MLTGGVSRCPEQLEICISKGFSISIDYFGELGLSEFLELFLNLPDFCMAATPNGHLCSFSIYWTFQVTKSMESSSRDTEWRSDDGFNRPLLQRFLC